MFHVVPKKSVSKKQYEQFIKKVDHPLKIIIHKTGVLTKRRAIQLIEKSKGSDKKINAQLEQLKNQVEQLQITPNVEVYVQTEDKTIQEKFLPLVQETQLVKSIKKWSVLDVINEVNRQ